jgi:transposase-like protein
MLAERGPAISNEIVRRWVLKFGPVVARNLRPGRVAAHDRWLLDEMVVSIAGRHLYLWRAVDSEGEVLDLLVQPRRDQAAARRERKMQGVKSAASAQRFVSVHAAVYNVFNVQRQLIWRAGTVSV